MATEMYRVRKEWADAKTQAGAFLKLENAKNACNKAGSEYKVFNSKGEIVYPTQIQETPKVEINTAAADPKVIWNYFKSKGLNDFGIAGLMGNLYAESGFKSCNLQGTYEKKLGMTDAEYTAAVDNGTYDNFVKDQAGYGLAQWTYWSLKQDLYNYLKKQNKSIGDLEGQMEFLAYQLSTSYKSIWTTLQNAKSILEASNAVLLKFERPADQSEAAQNKRAGYGQKYYDAYASKKVETPKEEVVENNKIELPKEGGNGKMKYSEKNKPLVCMQTQNPCYKGTRKMDIKGILWHSTGANNPNLKRYVQPSDNAKDKKEWLEKLGVNTNKNDQNHTKDDIGLNAWIGKLIDGTVATIQTMPWDYRPWGCASGSKGSCNDGWIQFEICEDNLNDKKYFNKIYTEACELTAYLCKIYDIDPKGSVLKSGVKVPTILCHADAHDLGFGSNHGDIYHWFLKYNKDMDDVRSDVYKLLNSEISNNKNETPKPSKKLYRVRKTWEDEKSQIGAYENLDNAKDACDKAGKEYEVYNPEGVAIYPTIVKDIDFKVGDEVKLIPNAKYANGLETPKWLQLKKLYVREILSNGNIVVSTQKVGAITGSIKPSQVVPYTQEIVINATSSFSPYIITVTTQTLNVRSNPGTSYKINTQIHKNELYTIVDEKDGWGKLKSGAGWIDLRYTAKLNINK